jgi:phosphoglycolate phosphatase
MYEQGATVKYKLVIFDFDGTIANSLPWFLHLANTIADTFKFRRIEESEIETLRGLSPQQVIRHLGVPMWKLPLIAHHVRALTAKNIDQIMLFEGADRLLRQLSDAGVTLAIVTSNSSANVRHVLGADHAALITYYECGTSIFGKGPRFRRILRQSGVRPSEALCIGDELRDLDAARKERIPFGAVAWGFTNVEGLKGYAPAEVFAEVGEIADAIL